MYERTGKRLFDIGLSLVALILLSPLLALAGAAILLIDGRPAVFSQRRVGRHGDLFTIYKFRTYPVGTPELPSAEAKALVPTPLGRLLRRTNIDELPQLFNILRGDMSVVGPRPGLPSQATQLRIRRENGAERLRPGITGLAQLRGFDDMPESEKARNDGEYAGSVSFGRDVAIILRTLLFILKRAPVY